MTNPRLIWGFQFYRCYFLCILVLYHGLDSCVLLLSSIFFLQRFWRNRHIPDLASASCPSGDFVVVSNNLEDNIWFPAEPERYWFLITLCRIAIAVWELTILSCRLLSETSRRPEIDTARLGLPSIWPPIHHDTHFERFLCTVCCRSLHGSHHSMVSDVKEVL